MILLTHRAKMISLPSKAPLKVKVLECPKWLRIDMPPFKRDLANNYLEVEPIFNRDGRYLVSRGCFEQVIYEHDDKAWIHKNQPESVRIFKEDLNWAEYQKVNILTRDQSKAIAVLIKTGLVSEPQLTVYRKDSIRRGASRWGLQLRRRASASVLK